MEPRLIDERDTVWESTTADFRVFIKEGLAVGTFDIDAASLSDVESWSRTKAGPSVTISIALRQRNSLGQPGLIWLEGEPI